MCFDGHVACILSVNGIARNANMVGIGNNTAADVGDSLIVVDADCNSGRNGCKRAAHGHRRTGTSGTEVSVVVSKDADGTCGHVAGDGIDRLMVGNVQSNCCSNLNRLGLGHGRIHVRGCPFLPGGVRLIHSILCLGGVGRGSRTGILAAQSIGRGGQIVAGRGLRTFAACAVVVGILGQLFVDLACSLVLIVVGLQVFFCPGALGDLIGILLDFIRTCTELAENTLHVSAHCSGQTKAVILVEGLCGKPCQTVDNQIACHVHIDIAVNNVDGNSRTHSRLCAGGESAGLRHGCAGLNGLHPQTQQILGSCLRLCQLLFCLFAILGGSKLLLIKGADVQIVGSSGHLRAGTDEAPDGVFAQIQRHRGIDGIGLGGVAGLFGFTGSTGIVRTGKRVGTGNRNGSNIVGSFCGDIQCAGIHNSVFANTGLGNHFAVVHGKGRADTNTAAKGSSSGGRIDELLLTGVQLPESCCDGNLLPFRNFVREIEGEDVACGVLLGRNLHSLATITNIIVEAIQCVAVYRIDRNQELLAGMGLGRRGFLTKVGNHRCCAACGVADSCGNVMNRSGILKECHSGNHRIFRQILYKGCVLITRQLEGSPSAISNIDGRSCTGIAAGQGNGLNLVVWIRGDRNRIVVRALGKVRNLTVVGAADHQRAVVVGTVAGILGSVSAIGLVGAAAGCQVAVRCALGANGCGGNGIHLLNGFAVDCHIAAYGNGAVGSSRFDQCPCCAIDHCNCDAARNTHMAGACASDGMGDEGVGGSGFRGFSLQLQPCGQGIQRGSRQGLAHSLQGVNGICLHRFCHIAFEEILQCGHINDTSEYLVGNIGGHLIQLRAGSQGVRVGIVFHRFTGKHRLNLGKHHVQDGVDYLSLDCFRSSRAKVGKPVFNSLHDIGGNQTLQAGAAEKSIHGVANHLGNCTVLAEEAFVESVPQFP